MLLVAEEMNVMKVDPVVAKEKFCDKVRCDIGYNVCLDMFQLDFQFDLTNDIQWS